MVLANSIKIITTNINKLYKITNIGIKIKKKKKVIIKRIFLKTNNIFYFSSINGKFVKNL